MFLLILLCSCYFFGCGYFVDKSVDKGVHKMKQQEYKVCATCINFDATKTNGGMKYRCLRLGFDTKPSYSFDCWDPKPHVIKLMETRKSR